jgi:hypothetical protein
VTDEAFDEQLEILNDREGVWRCRMLYTCTEACPARAASPGARRGEEGDPQRLRPRGTHPRRGDVAGLAEGWLHE